MVSLGEIGMLLGGIAALIGVIWTIITGIKNSRDLKNLGNVVKPMYTLLELPEWDSPKSVPKSANQKVEKPETGLLRLPKSPSVDPQDQELKRQELALRQRELALKQAQAAAATLGWIFSQLRADEEEDEDY